MTEEKKQMRYRTIPKAVLYFKEEDDDSAISEFAIRKAIKEQQLRSRRIGRRIIVELGDVEDYFRGDH